MRPLPWNATLILTSVFISPAFGAPHPEVTVIPMGALRIKQGPQEIVRALPRGPRGPLAQPIVLIASQPEISEEAEAEGESAETAADAAPRKRRVAATLKIRVGEHALPDWTLSERRTAYVIDREALRRNSRFADGRVAMTVELTGEAEQLIVPWLAMPDPLLLDAEGKAARSGPLKGFIEAAGSEETRAYFVALAQEIAGEQEAARAGYERLKNAADPRVARLARRGLRMLSYQLRERRLSGNFMEHYRWALYLQACGLFKGAFDEFEECRIIDPNHAESQFRAAECLERSGAGLLRSVHYIDRTGEASKVRDPTIWYALVTILKSRKDRTLTQPEIDAIKDNWHFAEKMIRAASDGELRIATSFHEIENERAVPYTVYEGGVHAPGDEIIEVRGWYDSVIGVRPRLEGEEGDGVAVAGADAGPNGTAVASVYHDARWPQFLKAIYGHLRWAADVAELEPGLPALGDALDCGQPPAPGSGAAYRGALRYHFGRDTFRRLNMAEVPVAGSYIRLWKIEGPYPVKGEPPAAGVPASHVLDTLPPADAAHTKHIVSDSDFIDLAALMPDAGWALARGTSWVFSPRDQRVQLNLGQNDGMALWLNGRLVRRGAYYSARRFEDRNWVDTICTAVDMKAGWNEVVAVAESWPPPRNRGWGFSVSLATKEGRPVPGLAAVHRRPQGEVAAADPPPRVGPYYAWPDVREDFRRRLPRLSDADLQTLTRVPGLALRALGDTAGGCVAFVAPGGGPRYREPPDAWDPAHDRDVVLNNLLDWQREACAACRYPADGGHRDLLLLRPEALEAYLTILKEPDSAQALFKGRPPKQRLLGYVLVRLGESERTLFLADTRLTDGPAWPADEEDLLTPYGPFVPNWPMEPGATSRPADADPAATAVSG